MKILSAIVITFFYLDYCHCEYPKSPNTRPIIVYEETPQNHFNQIQKRENEILQLNCLANYPIKWLIPDNSVSINFISK